MVFHISNPSYGYLKDLLCLIIEKFHTYLVYKQGGKFLRTKVIQTHMNNMLNDYH